MKNVRLFIDIPIEPNLAKQIHRGFSGLNLDWQKMKVVPAEQYHLNLKFLGDTDFAQIPKIISALEEVKINLEDINLELDSPAIFNPQNPRVLVLTFKKNEALQNLYTQIEEVLFTHGLAHKEVRAFRAHLTLARIKKSIPVEDLKEFSDWKINVETSISYFTLKESKLAKTGPEHNILQSFSL